MDLPSIVSSCYSDHVFNLSRNECAGSFARAEFSGAGRVLGRERRETLDEGLGGACLRHFGWGR